MENNTQAKHTPGEWYIETPDNPERPTRVIKARETAPGYADAFIASVCVEDASVISAAPDLLAALKGLAEYIKFGLELDDDGVDLDGYPTPAYVNAVRAIAKAEGRG